MQSKSVHLYNLNADNPKVFSTYMKIGIPTPFNAPCMCH